MRKITKLMAVLMVVAVLCSCFVGCSSEYKITDFYPQLENAPNSIYVDFGSPDEENYTITDQDTIEEICQILLSRTYVRRGRVGDTIPPGFNSRLTFSYDNEQIDFNTHYINKDGWIYWVKTNDNLFSKLYC